MPITRFPDPRLAGPEGLVAVGGDLSPESLLLAYRSGIFPWPIEGFPLAWFSPDPRAILELKRLHVPRRLARTRKNTPLRFTADLAFGEVIRACARARAPATWITPQMLEAYCELHRLGHAHSVEVWDGQCLVGGIYGVLVDGVFAGESMFHSRRDASKLALLELVERLGRQRAAWIDIQMLTPHLEALGARAIPRNEFLALLERTRARGLDLLPAFARERPPGARPA
jgi:leucyl/phenylalanyl-tRNA---protein transferase